VPSLEAFQLTTKGKEEEEEEEEEEFICQLVFVQRVT